MVQHHQPLPGDGRAQEILVLFITGQQLDLYHQVRVDVLVVTLVPTLIRNRGAVVTLQQLVVLHGDRVLSLNQITAIHITLTQDFNKGGLVMVVWGH
jgi:hypothetical protein